MDFRKCTRWLVIGVAVGILTGCSTTKDAEVTRLNHQLQERNQEIERLNVVLEKQRLPVEDELHMTVAIDALPANAQDAATQGGWTMLLPCFHRTRSRVSATRGS